MSYAVRLSSMHVWYEPILEPLLLPLRIFHFLLAAPRLIFLVALTAMLFRPPDLKSFPIDRIAFVALVILLALRGCLRREWARTYPATWPLLVLTCLGCWGAITQPYCAQAWSLFAEKWAVPFVMFHAAGLVFNDERSLRSLEVFLLAVLAYLCAVSILPLLHANAWIFPRFITDESVGIHADRARGPFLQAVANGVCLTLLGLMALDCFRRGRLHWVIGASLFLTVPIALVATRTRAVWFSAALCVGYLLFFGSARKLRRVALALSLAAAVGTGFLFISLADGNSLSERLLDRSPVDFRTEMYQAGWAMFTEKPLLGWGNEWMVQPEIEKGVSNFHPEYFVFHNTFLELAVQRGLLGLGVYLWLIVRLFRLSKCENAMGADSAFSSPHFRKLWPLLLGVYLLNACAVVMNYQFVNALLFTTAGILAARAGRKTTHDFSAAWSASR